jgi:AcrR family transcriptional regulator
MTAPTANRLKHRNQAARREESDRRMLRAAAHLVSQQGLRATTLAEIGLAAGYSSGLPVVRYGSKLGLIDALLEAMDQWCQTAYAAATAGRRGLESLKARIGAHIGSVRSIPEGAGALQTILLEARYSFPSLQPRLTTLLQHWREGIRDDLIDAQRLGEVRADLDCDAYADLILGATRGMTIDRVGPQLDELQRTLPSLLCEMVRLR